jgi:hypothetical protein
MSEYSEINAKFLEDYVNYLPQIANIIEKHSGKHAINLEKAQQWIDAQPTETSQNAARNIIKHTIYVSLKETEELVFNLINNNYRQITESNPGKKVHFFVGEYNKSNYWLSIIALKYIKQLKITEPTYYCKTIMPAHTSLEFEDILIYFDDMSYSGGQISHIIEKTVDNIHKVILRDTAFDVLKEHYLDSVNEYETKMIKEKDEEQKQDYEKHIRDFKEIIELFGSNYSEMARNIIYLKGKKPNERSVAEKKCAMLVQTFNYETVNDIRPFFISDAVKNFLLVDYFLIKKYQSLVEPKLANIKFSKIYFLLLGINKDAFNKISNIQKLYGFILDDPPKPIAKGLNIMRVPNNMKVEYNFKPYEIYYGKMYKTLQELIDDGKLTEEELFYMSYYFSYKVTPNLLIYFDHKIADEPSTFLRALNYGPIVPTNYDILNYVSIAEIRENVKDSFVNLKWDNLFEKYYHTLVKPTESQDINLPIRFIPFINKCYGVEKIINNPLMANVNYIQFISIVMTNEKNIDLKDLITEIKTDIIPPNVSTNIAKSFEKMGQDIYKGDNTSGNFNDLDEYDLADYNVDLLQQIKDIRNFIMFDINNNRCELSFYKTNYIFPDEEASEDQSEKTKLPGVTRRRKNRTKKRNRRTRRRVRKPSKETKVSL